MSGAASIEGDEVSRGRGLVLLGVYRYFPDDATKYEYLPNPRGLTVSYREGPDPGGAPVRYVFNPADPSTDPVSFQQALSVDSRLPHVVQNDERLVVRRYSSDGSYDVLFDGFAQVPELTLSPAQELVTFLAYGVAVREWDT